MMNKVLLVTGGHSDARVFDASSPEKLKAACLLLLKQLLAEDALDVGKEPEAPVEIPGGLPYWLHLEAERRAKHIRHTHLEWCKRGVLLKRVEYALSGGVYGKDPTCLALLIEAASDIWYVMVQDIEEA